MNSSTSTQRGNSISRPNSVVSVPCSRNNFYKYWCIFMRPFIYLTDKEIDVVACFLRIRQELISKTTDRNIVDSILMNNNTRKRVMSECNISLPHFYVIMGSLRKKKVIENDIINPKMIPDMSSDNGDIYQLVILFKKSPDNDV